MLLQGAITFRVEAPGVQQTTLANTIVETFDVLPVGPLSAYFAPLGVYSGSMSVSEPNAWGGAGQNRYLEVGAQSGNTSYEPENGSCPPQTVPSSSFSERFSAVKYWKIQRSITNHL
jgi:hypothetical protein